MLCRLVPGRPASFPFPVQNGFARLSPGSRAAGPPHHKPDYPSFGKRDTGDGKRVGSPFQAGRTGPSTITSVDPLRTGARLLSKGMRGGNGALTLLGALLAARGIVRWLDRPDRELLYSKRLKPGQSLRITVPKGD